MPQTDLVCSKLWEGEHDESKEQSYGNNCTACPAIDIYKAANFCFGECTFFRNNKAMRVAWKMLQSF
jgi:hypothetical protein